MGVTIKVSQDTPDARVLERVAERLGDGGCVVMPTDSVYGIGAAMVAGNPGHRRVFDIKRRPYGQTLPLLMADVEDLDTYAAEVSPWVRRLGERLWPGALTLVVRASASVPPEYVAPNGTVAVRVPDSNLVRQLIRQVGVPVATTSANLHGSPSPASAEELDDALLEADVVLDGGEAPVGVPSTIVGCLGEAPEILREGGVATCEVMDAIA